MRNFKLRNKNGTIYNLTSVSTDGSEQAFFHQPVGLGFAYEGNFAKVGNNFLRTKKRIAQKSIGGTIHFNEPGAYSKYFDFVRFVEKEGLVLLYNPKGRKTQEYEFDVELTELTKSELQGGGLFCKAKFSTLSLPRKIVYAESQKSNQRKNVLKIPYTLKAVPVAYGGNFIDSAGQRWIADVVDFQKSVLIKKCVSLELNTGSLNGSSKYPSYFLDEKIINLRKIYGEGDLKDVPVINEFGGTWNINTDPTKPQNNILWVTPFSYGAGVDGVALRNLKLPHEIVLGATENRIVDTVKLSKEELEAYRKMYTYNPKTYVTNDSESELEFDYIDINNRLVSVKGKTFELVDSSADKVKSLKVYGKSWQDGMAEITNLEKIKHSENPTLTTSDSMSTDVKNYNYRYNYQYTGGDDNRIIVDVDSAINSPMELIIRGEVTNPVWKHYCNGKLIGTGRVNATILKNNNLVICSKVPYSILQKDDFGNVVNDLYSKSDFATERFIFLRHGKNVISVSDDSGKQLNISMKGYIEYASV